MRPARTQRGIAVVTAIMIVALAAAIAAQVAFAHQVWLRQMENAADRGATDWLRRGALHWVSTALIDDAARGSTDHLGERWAQGLPTLPVEGGSIHVSIEDAQGRFNLNDLLRNNAASAPDIEIFRRLLVVLSLQPALADALVDWIDADGEARPAGAEDIEYLNGKPSYRTGNQRLASVEELRLVRGFDAKTVAALAPYVTVLPVDSTINVNTAPAPVLSALIPGLDVASAQRIADKRLEDPFPTVAALAKSLPQGIPVPQGGTMDVKSGYFLVAIDTQIGRHERRTEALVSRAADGKSTSVVWHRMQSLQNPDANPGSD
jgi:general secretion pathway protein K